MTGEDRVDEWAVLGARFVDHHYGSLRGRVRTHVVHEQLRDHLAPPPLRIVDIGGGAGHQSLPLARLGYDVTIVDPSPAMLQRAHATVAAADLDERVRLVQATGQHAPDVLGGERFGAVLCHGVLMYLDDTEPMLDALGALVAVDGLLSIVAKNVETMALRPALEGDWATALAAFETDHQINGLGVETRGDSIPVLTASLQRRGIDTEAWYGVRLFTDGWAPRRPLDDPEDLVLQVELTASRRDPYRQLSRLFHLVGRRARPTPGAG